MTQSYETALLVSTGIVLTTPIGAICDLYDPEECWNYFKAAGYVSN
jgi:hypothetical protein